MAKYVPDVKTQRWVIIAPKRTARPTDEIIGKAPNKKSCPFCPGNESFTPSEVYRVGPGEKNKPGWLVRVVPNKYPITDTHEVIIHSPNDDLNKDIENLPLEQTERIFTAYRDRFRIHANDGQVLIFCNHGMHAGASLTHPHSQLVVVPKQINLDALSREPITNMVEEGANYYMYCPDFSQWPFEVWIAPKVEGQMFGDVKDELIPDLAHVMQKALKKIEAVFNNPALSYIHAGILFGYNYYISHSANWFIRIIPRFIHRAGFELGTGLNVNVLDPTDAARLLSEA